MPDRASSKVTAGFSPWLLRAEPLGVPLRYTIYLLISGIILLT